MTARIALETPTFRRDFRRADKRTQEKIEEFIRKFDEDSTRDGLRLKPLQKQLHPRVRTARVDDDLRAVLVDVGDGDYALVRVLRHDPAIRFAEGLRPDISALNGLPRLVQIAHIDVPAAPPVDGSRTSVDLFAHRTDADLVAAGVPEFAVAPLRAVSDHAALTALAGALGSSDPMIELAILELRDTDRTVDQVIDALLTLDGPIDDGAPRRDGAWSGTGETGEARPSFDTADLTAALERPGAAERFRVVESSEELVAALNGDFSDWQVFLHPLQRKAAYETRFSGPARVSGGAGTGKTVVLLHRIKALLERPDQPFPPRVLLTTFTPHLEADLRRLLARLIPEEQLAQVEITTVDGLAWSLHDQMDGSPVQRLTAEEEDRLWRTIVDERELGRSPTFLRNEYRHVVLARGVRSMDAYLATTRSGRGVALGPDARRTLWPAFETFEARTRSAGKPSTLQLTESVAALLEQAPANLYDHVLVDEAQDLHAAQWRLLRALVPEGEDDLFIAGDAMQRIYGDTVSLRSVGIETRGRSMRLKRNYRSTHEIIGWALGVVRDSVAIDLDELGADLSGYHSVRQGPTPETFPCRDRAEELEAVEHAVRGWFEVGHPPDAIAVVARTTEEVDAIVTALQRRRVPVAKLGRRGRVAGMVNVATMGRVKGLEYPCVVVTGLSDATLPPPGSVCPADEDDSQHRNDLQTERSLVYVAASRARDELALTWCGSLADHLHPVPQLTDVVPTSPGSPTSA